MERLHHQLRRDLLIHYLVYVFYCDTLEIVFFANRERSISSSEQIPRIQFLRSYGQEPQIARLLMDLSALFWDHLAGKQCLRFLEATLI